MHYPLLIWLLILPSLKPTYIVGETIPLQLTSEKDKTSLKFFWHREIKRALTLSEEKGIGDRKICS